MVAIAVATERIYNVLRTEYSASTLTFDNEKFVPAAGGAAYARATVRHRLRAQESLGRIGARKFESRGAVIVQCFSALDTGRDVAETLAQAVRTILEGRTLTPEAIHFFAADIREIGEIGGRYQVNAECFFMYAETK